MYFWLLYITHCTGAATELFEITATSGTREKHHEMDIWRDRLHHIGLCCQGDTMVESRQRTWLETPSTRGQIQISQRIIPTRDRCCNLGKVHKFGGISWGRGTPLSISFFSGSQTATVCLLFIYLFIYWQTPPSINNEDGEQSWLALHASRNSYSSALKSGSLLQLGISPIKNTHMKQDSVSDLLFQNSTRKTRKRNKVM